MVAQVSTLPQRQWLQSRAAQQNREIGAQQPCLRVARILAGSFAQRPAGCGLTTDKDAGAPLLDFDSLRDRLSRPLPLKPEREQPQ